MLIALGIVKMNLIIEGQSAAKHPIYWDEGSTTKWILG